MTKSAVEAGIVRAKNARQKRKIQKAAPKVYENTKQTVFIKGGNVSQNITNLMHDLNRLKQEKCSKMTFAEIRLILFARYLKYNYCEPRYGPIDML